MTMSTWNGGVAVGTFVRDGGETSLQTGAGDGFFSIWAGQAICTRLGRWCHHCHACNLCPGKHQFVCHGIPGQGKLLLCHLRSDQYMSQWGWNTAPWQLSTYPRLQCLWAVQYFQVELVMVKWPVIVIGSNFLSRINCNVQAIHCTFFLAAKWADLCFVFPLMCFP